MGYAYFKNDRWRDPKLWEAGLAASGLDIYATLYASRYLTDGFIPSNVLSNLSVGEKVAPLANKLVKAGVWTYDKEKGGYWIVDYLEGNPTREEVLAEKKRKSDRGKKAINARWAKHREAQGEVTGNSSSGEVS